MIHILPFDGNSVDVYDFIEQSDNIVTLAQWPPLVQAQMMSAYLIGDAKVLFYSLQQIERLNIDFVKHFLICEYAVSKENYWNQFLQRLPKPNESIKSYALSIQTLLKRAWPDMPQAQRDQVLINKLTNVLPAHIQVIVKVQDRLNWLDVIKFVEKLIAQFGINKIHSLADPLDADLHRISKQPFNHPPPQTFST